jgi:hypothetical protein
MGYNLDLSSLSIQSYKELIKTKIFYPAAGFFGRILIIILPYSIIME